MSSRRGFLKLIGLAPIAAPAAAQAVAAQNSAGALRSMAWAGFGHGDAPMPAAYDGGPAWTKSGLGKLVWKALRRESEERREQFERGIGYRFGAYEADIAAMKSWSPSFQVHRQRLRDDAHRDYQRDTTSRLWPQRDDE